MFLRTLIPLLATAGLLCADVKLPAIFSDHAVLQKTAKAPIWGTADPGEKISITLGTSKAEATADATGKWQTALDLSQSGEGPFELIVKGNNQLTIKDVLVGEVWVCSGQSNMEWKLGQLVSFKDEAPQANLPRLRQFLIGRATSAKPVTELQGTWKIATPETAKDFTAVGYYFGKALEKNLQRPVGLISTAWGGTPVEPWIPLDALSADAGLKQEAESLINRKVNAKPLTDAYIASLKTWEEKYQLTDSNPGPLPDDVNWQPLTKETTPKEPGVTWYRHPFTLTAAQAGKPFPVALKAVDGMDQIYWNGQLIDKAPPTAVTGNSKRVYSIPADQVKEGPAMLLVRVFNSSRSPVMEKFDGNAPWEVKVEKAAALSAEAKSALPVNPGNEPNEAAVPTFLYNAMVHPILPYGIRGAIWYQGESNAGDAPKYRKTFPLLIQGWRKVWNQGDFPFYFCQLANFGAKTTNADESGWADLRDAQLQTTSLPNTGQAVLIDIGESGDIHPQNKADVGKRLALLALARTYDRKIVDSGPVYQSMKIEGPQIRLQFSSADGLVAQPVAATYPVATSKNETAPLVRNSPNSELEGFAICGEDKKWVWADAKIEGDTVIVSSPLVAAPTAVRYGWSHNPNVNLYNRSGLPAGPFRTDAAK